MLVADRKTADLLFGGIVILSEMGDFLLKLIDGLIVLLNSILHCFVLNLHFFLVLLHFLNAIIKLHVLKLDHSVKLNVIFQV